jgi:murein L,D-transpeptidase YafK
MRLGLAAVFALCLATSSSTLASAEPPAPAARQDVRIVVKKAARRLFLHDGAGRVVASYPIALGGQPVGAKREEGDGATPEGEYYVTHGNPRSQFHLSLGISYPNVEDAGKGLARGLISRGERESIAEAIEKQRQPPQHTKLGGDIFLHGGGTSTDWTAGCIALENAHIDELFARVPVRTRVTILP